MSKLYFSKVICHLWSILSWRKNLILNFVIFKFSEKFGKNFNDSSSNFKMTFWIKIRNSASSYNRFVSSWKGMKSHFSHRHHLQALNATRVGQKFKNLIKIFKEYSYFERNEPFLDPSYFVVCRRVRFSLMFLKAVLITW